MAASGPFAAPLASSDKRVQRVRYVRFCGIATALLGAIVLIGWSADLPVLKTVVSGLASMKANTALMFLLSGVALAQMGVVGPRAPVWAKGCAIAVLAFGMLTLIEHIWGLDLGIDQLLFADPGTPPAHSPGRMALATSLVFVLAGAALLVLGTTTYAVLASGLGIGIAIVGALALAGYAIRLDALYAWPAFGAVAAHTAAGFLILGIGILMAGRARLPAASEDLRIAGLAASLLALATAATGLAAYSSVESAFARSIADGVTLALAARVGEIRNTIELRNVRAEIVTTRPNMLRNARLHVERPDNAEYRDTVRGVLESFMSHGFSAIAVVDRHGETYARTGAFVASPALEVPLSAGAGMTLLWSGRFFLRSRLPLRDATGTLGQVLAEQPLPNVDEAVRALHIAGESAELLLCASGAEAFSCFPSRLSPTTPFSIPVTGGTDRSRLVRRAAESGAGFGAALDYRGRQVLGAFTPVGATGLVAVLKVDADELYAPLAARFQLTLLLVAAFSIGGALLVRAKVRPLASALEQRVRDRTAQLEEARDALDAHARRLGILHEIDRAIISEVKPEAIAAAVLQPLRELLGVPRANVNLINRATGEGEWLASAGRRRVHAEPGVRFPLHMLGNLEALERGEPQTIETAALPSSPQRDALLASGIRHYMAVPMIAGGELIGALSFGGQQPSFPAERTAIAQETATQLGIAIGHARLFERATSSAEALAVQAERLRIVHEVDRAIISEVKPEAIAAAVLQPLRQMLLVPRVVVNLFDFARGEVEWLAAAGRRQTRSGPGVRYPLNFMGDVSALRRGETQTIETAALPDGDHKQALLASDVRRYMAVPMIVSGELIGAVSFGGERATFSSEQIAIAQETATQLGIAISQARLLERVRGQAEELEQRVRERTAQLEYTNGELEAFCYSVSHDLRAPLRAIDGFSLALIEDCSKELSEEALGYLARVRSSTERMAQLIEDLLNLSRVSRGELSKEDVDLGDLARKVVAELRQREPGRSVEVSISDRMPARGDARLLRAALENLIGNAWKFTSKSAHPHIEVGALRDGTPETFFVRDNGAGFDMRYSNKLFGAFQRLHSMNEYQGTGIGLATVQRIVHRHGGRIWADAHPGRGAVFFFTLEPGDLRQGTTERATEGPS